MFDQLDFWSISNLIFTAFVACKNPVRNGLKIHIIELDFSNSIFQKSSAEGQGVRFQISAAHLLVFQNFLLSLIHWVKLKLNTHQNLSLFVIASINQTAK